MERKLIEALVLPDHRPSYALMAHEGNTLRILFMIGVVLIFLIRPAISQEAGDPLKGAAYAREHCVACHTLKGDEQLSPSPKAPTFKAVANSPGITATALLVWFRTFHPTMPNLIIDTEDQKNLAAYIISLRESR